MTIEQSLLTVLAGGSPAPTAAGDRVYAVLLPQNTAQPSIRYQRISNVPMSDYEGDTGLDNARMQIDCYAATYGAAKQLAAQVRALLDASSLKHYLTTDRDDFEQETKLYVVSLDASLWGAS